ncbi:MAG: SDR family NAD(P)-dependent oxidoreductase [Hyphomicrobiales bacterium]|nr:SDR family NAD(P)-dependent oxidoreductase [Hyphomicrobiales bacterium]
MDQRDIAVVFGATGGIGSALTEALRQSGQFREVVGFSRLKEPRFNVENEATIKDAAEKVANRGVPALLINAIGLLHSDGLQPEKSLRSLNAETLARLFAVNAVGPALLMKHFLPLLSKNRRAVFATLSAKVGSIGDNALGGWYGYRASKAALNQFVRTASIELARTNPLAVCVAVHPGTVDTALSKPFARIGLPLQTPAEAASTILQTLSRLTPGQSGSFIDRYGETLPW